MATATSAILLDVEGTTTPVDFVHNTLFSYARRHLADFLRRNWEEPSVRADVQALKDQYELDANVTRELPAWQDDSRDAQFASVLSYVNWLMSGDSKCALLKSLQGKIWQEGYQRRELQSQIYSDVPAAFSRWSPQRIICIFSSGSVLAQRLLFAHSCFGDLTSFIRDYFDTTTGAKRDPVSYRKIAASLALRPSEIIFISDVVEELDAARQVEMETALCVRSRDGSFPIHTHKVIYNFDSMFP